MAADVFDVPVEGGLVRGWVEVLAGAGLFRGTSVPGALLASLGRLVAAT